MEDTTFPGEGVVSSFTIRARTADGSSTMWPVP
jgi:hypothetical protein